VKIKANMYSIKSITVFLIIFSLHEITFSQTPTIFPGYPIKIDSLRSPFLKTGVPYTTDLDKDGKKEIIAVGTCVMGGCQPFFLLHALKNDGKDIQGFPKGYNTSLFDFAVGDVDGNGYIDIAVRLVDSIDVIDRAGNHLPGFPVFYPSLNSPPNWILDGFINLYDLDGDGKLEIITSQYGALAVFDYQGQMKPGWPRPTIGRVRINPAIGDLDRDGKAEIVTSQYKELFGPTIDSANICISRYDGTIFPGNWPVILDSSYYVFLASPTIYINVTGNNSFIIIPYYRSHELQANIKYIKFDMNGNIIKSFFLNLDAPYNDKSVEIGDINKDGQMEFATAISGGMDLYLFNLNFNILSGWPQMGAGNFYNTPAIVKLTNGFDLNILSPAHYAEPGGIGLLYGYNKSGAPLSWSPLRTTGIVSGLCIDDINNDGSVELITTNGKTMSTFYINIWTIPGIAFNHDDFPWPVYCHDRYKSNQYGFIPPDEPIGIQPTSNEVPDKFVLLQNYPNPFNPATTIKYQIRTSSLIKLTVYDVLGREVTQIVNENQKPGTYSVSFDGSNLSSGVYYYRLTTDGEVVDTKKMMMIK
jgi:hypothetical protein